MDVSIVEAGREVGVESRTYVNMISMAKTVISEYCDFPYFPFWNYGCWCGKGSKPVSFTHLTHFPIKLVEYVNISVVTVIELHSH